MTTDQGKAGRPSMILVGQANLHKNAECAVTLANHIYHQMRELDITKSHNLNDRNSSSRPRRGGLPTTVSEWKELRKLNEERRSVANDKLLGTQQHGQIADISDTREPANSPCGSQDTNMSKEIDDFLSRIRKEVEGKKELEEGLNIMTPNPSNPKVSNKNSTPPVDLKLATAKGRRTGVGLAGFLYAVQEPNIKFRKIVNIRNAICIMDHKCMSRKRRPENPRAAIICSVNMNIWPISDYCNRDMATGLLKGSDIGDAYIVSLYCDGALKQAVPILFKQLVSLAKREGRQVLALMDSNSHSESLWSSKNTDSKRQGVGGIYQ